MENSSKFCRSSYVLVRLAVAQVPQLREVIVVVVAQDEIRSDPICLCVVIVNNNGQNST